jgi:hypothetical protein
LFIYLNLIKIGIIPNFDYIHPNFTKGKWRRHIFFPNFPRISPELLLNFHRTSPISELYLFGLANNACIFHAIPIPFLIRGPEVLKLNWSPKILQYIWSTVKSTQMPDAPIFRDQMLHVKDGIS